MVTFLFYEDYLIVLFLITTPTTVHGNITKITPITVTGNRL